MNTGSIEANQNASHRVVFTAPVQKRPGTNEMRNSSWRLSELSRQWQTTKVGNLGDYSLDVKGWTLVYLFIEHVSSLYFIMQSAQTVLLIPHSSQIQTKIPIRLITVHITYNWWHTKTKRYIYTYKYFRSVCLIHQYHTSFRNYTVCLP